MVIISLSNNYQNFSTILFFFLTFRDVLGDKKMEVTLSDFFPKAAVRQLLILQDFETFSKNRNSLMLGCLRQVVSLEQLNDKSVMEILERELMPHVKGLVHYDVFNYWALYLQVNGNPYLTD